MLLSSLAWGMPLQQVWAKVSDPPPLTSSLGQQIQSAFRESTHGKVLQLLKSYPAGHEPSPRVLKLGVLSALHLGKPDEAFSTYQRLIPAGAEEDTALLRKIAWGMVARHTRHAQEFLRMTAMTALAETADPQAVPLLEDGLLDMSIFVRAKAVEALGRTGLSGHSAKLAAALKDPAAAVRIAAMNAIAPPQPLSTKTHLIKVAQSGIGAEHVFALAALVRLGSSEALEELLSSATLPEPDIRMAAIGALSQLKNPASFRVLSQAVYDPNPSVRAFAAGALGELGLPDAASPLTHAIGDENPQVRRLAAVSLGRLNIRHARTLLWPLSRDPNPMVQAGAVEGLVRLGDREALLLATDLSKHPNPAIRSAIAQALGLAQSPQAISIIGKLLQDPHPQPRQAAARALASLSDQKVVPFLKQALKDREPAVKITAAGSLIRQLDKPHS